VIRERKPLIPAPWPPLRSNDALYRYPKPYPVGGTRGESLASIAKRHGMTAADLLIYNFRTRHPEEVNWYLGNYVGCKKPQSQRTYYTFDNATYDEAKHSGMIFIPMYGEPLAEYTNRLGQRAVDDYSLSTNKGPGGACYATCYSRVKAASKQVGIAVPDWTNTSDFGRLWGSLISPKDTWLELPEEYRGKGAAGAVANEGLGTLVDSQGIWSGDLKPGAVVQVWKVSSDYDNVRDGLAPSNIGHSFLFMHYVRSGAGISAIVIADQGYQGNAPLVKGDWSYWVAANLTPAA
jgi:hypothetical protein